MDQSASKRIHKLRLGVADYPLAVPAMMFGSYVMPVTIVGVGAWMGWEFLVAAAINALTILVVTTPMKRVIARERPYPLAHRRVNLRKLVGNFAMPSGDSAQAAGLATLVLMVDATHPLGWVLAGLVPVCMFARVYFGAHWIGDTLVGAVIGGALGVGCALVLMRLG